MHRAIACNIELILCTVLLFTEQGTRMERIYSSHPAEYPVGGVKEVTTDVSPAWVAVTRDSNGVFVARTPAEIAQTFGDAPQIAALGCGSIVNVPLHRDDGSTWATVNLLGPEGGFSPHDVAAIEVLVQLHAPREVCELK